MRQVFYLTLLALIVYSCGENATNTRISGRFTNSKNERVILQELTVSGVKAVDSVSLSGSGRFKFKLKLEQPSFYKIIVGKQRPVTLIVKPKDRIHLTGRADSLYNTYSVSGSEESVNAMILDKRIDKTVHLVDSLNNVYHMFANNPNIANIEKVLKMNYDHVIDDQRAFTKDFIEKHPKSLASVMALYQQTDDKLYVLYKEEDVKYYALLDSLLYPLYPKASFVIAVHDNLTSIRDQKKKEELLKIMGGMNAPAKELSLPNTSGKNVSLSSLKGKTVLIYAWASWCDSCRKESVRLQEVYKKYKSKGFEIYAVSLDKSKNAWINAINQDKINNWVNVSDLKYWDSAIVPLYNFDSLPMTFLVDKEGVLIGRGLKDEALDGRLELLFKAN